MFYKNKDNNLINGLCLEKKNSRYDYEANTSNLSYNYLCSKNIHKEGR